MKRIFLFALIGMFGLSACDSIPAALFPTETPTLTATPTPSRTPTPTITPTPTATPTPTPAYPSEGYGPVGFPVFVNPLTGLEYEGDFSILDRRPVAVKVSNLPRNVRPQWGLSLADHVYEYYTEEGSTRFIALYYGNDAEMVGSVRSARFFDHHIITMYKANFAFGSADYRVRNLMYNQNYADRLVIESSCPPMCRFEPQGANLLVADTAGITELINGRSVPGGNGRQNLDGLFFRYPLPYDGQPADHVYVRYSGAIYNYWDYDPETGKYFRYAETANDTSGDNPQYEQATDRLTGEPITADNVVVVYITHQYYSRNPEIVDIVVSGPGKAYLFRDGQMFELVWYRNALDQLIIYATQNGEYFPFKPGNTWFQVVGSATTLTQEGDAWRFRWALP